MAALRAHSVSNGTMPKLPFAAVVKLPCLAIKYPEGGTHVCMLCERIISGVCFLTGFRSRSIDPSIPDQVHNRKRLHRSSSPLERNRMSIDRRQYTCSTTNPLSIIMDIGPSLSCTESYEPINVSRQHRCPIQSYRSIWISKNQ